MSRALFLHLGCSKTGTSSFQFGLWKSAQALERFGVGLPFRDRAAHVDHLLVPLGWRQVEGFADPVQPEQLARVPQLLRDQPGDRLFVSCEDLAEVTRPAAEQIAGLIAAAGLELRLVLTVRGWDVQLPSEYQQFLRHRMTLTYPEFVESVRNRTAPWGERFWRRQDAAGVLQTWSGLVPADLSTVVVVPSYTDDPDGIFRLMGEAVGFDGAVLRRPRKAINASYGVVEAELWRRVNLALGERLADYDRQYAPSLRDPFRSGAIPRQASPRVGLPEDIVGWLQDQGRATVATLTERRYRCLGEVARLIPSADAAQPTATPAEEDIAAAAVGAIAGLADRHDQRVKAVRARRAARGEDWPQSVAAPSGGIAAKSPGLPAAGVGRSRFDRRRTLVFTHVPKAAGVSMGRSLEAALETAATPVQDLTLFGDFAHWDSVALKWQQSILGVDLPKLPPESRLVVGHVSATATFAAYPDAAHVILLREPRARLLSHWVYWRSLTQDEMRAQGWGRWAEILTRAYGTFEDFLRDPAILQQTDNCVVRLLVSGHPLVPGDARIDPANDAVVLDAALAVLSRYEFADIIENRGWLRSCREWIGPGFAARRSNETKPPPPQLRAELADQLTPGALEALTHSSRLDAALWDALAARVVTAGQLSAFREAAFATTVAHHARLLAG